MMKDGKIENKSNGTLNGYRTPELCRVSLIKVIVKCRCVNTILTIIRMMNNLDCGQLWTNNREPKLHTQNNKWIEH